MKGSIEQAWADYFAERSLANRNRLVEWYLPLVRRLAGKLWRSLADEAPLDTEDLFSEGCVGLMRAIERFDPARRIRFQTFCPRHIHGAMIDALRRLDWVPRLERTRQKQGLVEPPRMASLDRMRSFGRETEGRRDGEALAELLRDDSADDPSKRAERLDVWRSQLAGLSKSERLVLLLYYGESLTMKQIGRHIGVGENRVSQIHHELLERLGGRAAPPDAPSVPAAARKESDVSDKFSEAISSLTLEETQAKIEAHQKELKALRFLYKYLYIKEHGTPPPMARRKGKGGDSPAANGRSSNGEAANGPVDDSDAGRLRRVTTFLEANGPAKQAAIAKAAEIPMGSITQFMQRHETHFRRADDGTYSLKHARRATA